MKRCYFLILSAGIIAGCTQEQKKTIASTIPQAPKVQEPFRFHKLLEVSPGQYYDILSWGRGGVDTGSFLILHSDSAGRKYTTTTGDLKGNIIDVYNSDMDADGHPEILIQAKGKDTINYSNIYAFEIYEGKVQKLDFPKLTSSQHKGYRGNDNFYISEGKLEREFPLYEGSGVDAKPTGQKRKLEYSLDNNNFYVKQLSKDSTKNSSVPVKQSTAKKKTEEPAKKQTESKKTGKSNNSKAKKTEKKHKKTENHKKKRKKRHHHSDDDDSQ